MALGGTVVGSSGLQSASQPTTATYQLVWDRNVTGCATVATTTSSQYASVLSSGNTTTVYLWGAGGGPGGGTSVHVAAHCPS